MDNKLITAIVANKDDDLKYKKQQIELYFSIHPDETERTEYLKTAYQDRYTEIMVDKVRVGYKPQENGLLMWEGAYLSRTKESVFSWGVVAGLVAQLIEKSEYHINTDIKGLVTQEGQQLTLFDLNGFDEPATRGSTERPPLFSHPRLPQQVIDEALCIGANDQNSRLIVCAYFMKDKPLEENARFLSEHYGVNGAGFYLNDRQYAIWYDGDGIRVGGGESVQWTSAALVTWAEAAKRIRELLDMGRYMPQRELDQTADYERNAIADSLLLMFREIEDTDARERYFPALHAVYETKSGFPEMTAEVVKLLEQPERLQALVEGFQAFVPAYEQNQELLRFHYHHPKELLQKLTDLQREPLIFTANQGYDPQRRFFISGDEIDNVLRGGKRSTDYRLGVYSQYRRFPDHQGLVKYLKHCHGEYSGFCGGNDDRTYTSKGLYFSHGSISEPYAKVELSWPKAASRIEALIKQNRFLSDADRAAIPTYEQERVARSVYYFFDGVSGETPCPFPRNFNYWDGVKYVNQQFSDPAKVEEIYQLMLPVWEGTPQDDRYYTSRKEGMDTLTAFRDGTFSLFGERKAPRSPVTTSQEVEAAAEGQDTPADTGAETVARYVSDEEQIVIQRYPGGQYYNRYGYDEQSGGAASTAGGFATLDEAEKAVYAHCPLAEPDPQSLRANVRDCLEELGYVVSEELLDVGLAEYAACGRRGSAEDIADYIEDELLSEEPAPGLTNDEPEANGSDKTNDDLIGKEVTIDGHRFIVDSVGEISKDVTLRDATVEGWTGSPVFRVEKSETVRGLLGLAEKEQPAPATERPKGDELLGKELTIDGRRFAVDRVDNSTGKASLRDVTFKNGVGFPIFREENIGTVRELLKPAEKEQAPVLSPPRPKRERVVFTTLHPEIPTEQRHDFHITDPRLGYGTPGEKIAANTAAIRCLKQIEFEERLATTEEQATLSRYVGWGGLADCFDERNSHYQELKTLLDTEEYAAARASSLTAFYTSPVIIQSIYQALSQMGLQRGNILEPSCGVGNFIGMLPEGIADSKLYGVELDSISGRIAQQLYQNSSISANGFEKVQMPDSFFDAAVGNVPFGDFKVRDRRYDKHHWLIHDYFFGKTLDKVRPGGIVAFITSKGTMDKENPAVRKYLAQRADLIGAIRLPNSAFKQNAGTEVTSDILFIQKRDRMTDLEPDWVHLDADENDIRMNRYFIQHPEMILGEMVMESTRFGMDSTCRPDENADLAQQLQEAIQNLHAELTDYEREEPDEEDRSIPADPAVKNFSYCMADGQIYFRENSLMYPVEVSVTAESRIRGMIALRECVRRLIEYQTEGYPDEDIQKEQAQLNMLYDSYTKKYGLLSSRGNSLAFGEDASYCLLCSLEVLDEEGNLQRKADMFTKRTIRPHEAVTSVDTASEALAVSISEKAGVDMEYMAALTGKTEMELAAELDGVIFRDIRCAETPGDIPAAFVDLGRFPFVAADEYLSGNVRRKLRMAAALYEVLPAEKKPLIAQNVQALTAVQPVDLNAAEIGVRIGSNWIPVEVYQQFMEELFGTSPYAKDRIKIIRSQATGQWAITDKNADRGNIKAIATYGTKRMTAYHILEQTLNQKDVRVFDYVEDGDGNKRPVLNKKDTAIAQDRQELIKSKFPEWLWRDIDRRERLCAIYNETFNSIRPREYDGRHITFSGMNPEIALRKHQIDAIAHIMYGGNTLLAHEVGAGKSATRS